MKSIFSLISLLFTCIQVSDCQVNNNIQDPAVEPYLNALSRLFDPQKAFQVEFKYEIESKADDYKVNDYGSIIIKGQKYKLKIEDGESYFNGEKLWVYNAEAAEVYSSIPDKGNPEQMLVDPFRLLSTYKEYYKYNSRGEVNLNGKHCLLVELYPKNLKTSYSILRLYFDKKTSQLFSLEMQEKKGIIYKILINEIISPVSVNESAFNWDGADHPDVMEIEL